MKRALRLIRLASMLCGYVAAALIVAAVVVVCEMVFVRYALGANTIWQTDFVTYCLIAATFIGSSFVLMTRGHVNVDILPQYVRERSRWWLALIAAVTTFALCLILTALTSRFWAEAWSNGWVSDTMWRARLWIPYASMPIGLGLLTLQSFADLFNLLGGREPPFGIGAGKHR